MSKRLEAMVQEARKAERIATAHRIVIDAKALMWQDTNGNEVVAIDALEMAVAAMLEDE